MNENLFNVSNFIRKLNNLSGFDERIKLGDFYPSISFLRLTNPIRRAILGTEIETKGEYPILQEKLGVLTGNSYNELIGKIYIEKGVIDVSSEYSGEYEEIDLQVFERLRIRDQKLPPFRIKMYKTLEEFGNNDSIIREDYVRTGGFWIRSNLEGNISSSWFKDELNFSSKPSKSF